jgi:hypothetical protein
VILGNMVLPGFLDRYLARAAYEAQETRTPVSPSRKDNLFEPVHDRHRTRGRFGDESTGRAVVAAGPAARLAPILAGSEVMVAAGLLLGRLMSPRKPGPT